VAVLGASNKIYVEAFADQKLNSWIQGHVHAYAFYGGVPALTHLLQSFHIVLSETWILLGILRSEFYEVRNVVPKNVWKVIGNVLF
jgi:hypothetical protein